VVWNIFDFPFHIWDVILPIDKLIFFKMVKTTNQVSLPEGIYCNSSFHHPKRSTVDFLLNTTLGGEKSAGDPFTGADFPSSLGSLDSTSSWPFPMLATIRGVPKIVAKWMVYSEKSH